MQAKRNPGPRRVRIKEGIYRRRADSGSYEVYCTTEDGKAYFETIVGGLREAEARRAELVSKRSRGERIARTRVTFDEYADEWLATQDGRVRPRTHARYEGDLRIHARLILGRRKLSSITVDDIAALIVAL